MSTRTPHTTTLHRLRRNHLLALPQPRGLCLRAERGTLWVTIDGEAEDIELEPGHSRVFDGQATVRVSALGGPAILSATVPTRASWRQRLRGWLRPAPRGALA